MRSIFSKGYNALSNLALLVLQVFLIGAAAETLLPGSGAFVAIGLFVLAFILPAPKMQGLAMNQVLKQMVSKSLTEKLFPSNAFYNGCLVDQGVIGCEKFIIPQEEVGETEIEEDVETQPLETVVVKGDRKEYNAIHLMSKPVMLGSIDELITDYDRRQALERRVAGDMETRIGDIICYGFNPTKASQIIRTTGASTAAAAPGATGLRKMITEDDILEAMTLFKEGDVPAEGARMLVPPRFMKQLMKIDDFVKYEKRGVADIVTKGLKGWLHGFEIVERSKTTLFTNAATPVKKHWRAAAAEDDNLAILFFHTNEVRYGKSDVEFTMDREKQVGFSGKRFHTEAMVGSTTSRESEKGVIALVEAEA